MFGEFGMENTLCGGASFNPLRLFDKGSVEGGNLQPVEKIPFLMDREIIEKARIPVERMVAIGR